MLFRKTLCKVEETEQCSDCCSDVDCDARKSWVETGSVAIEGWPLGHCRWGGKGGRIRTVPVPNWCKGLVDVWLHHSKVSEGKVFRRVLKNGAREDAGVTANVVWYAVKQCAKRAGI
jgi:integrase